MTWFIQYQYESQRKLAVMSKGKTVSHLESKPYINFEDSSPLI